MTKNEGWTWLVNSKKWHYFVDGRSLCGSWMYLGSAEHLELGNDNSPDNCAKCKKALQKRAAEHALEQPNGDGTDSPATQEPSTDV